MTRSLWMTVDAPPRVAPLQARATCDVCVVGAGIAGLMTAYLLELEGHSVVVLDKGAVSGGETARSTAHLSFALDDRYYELERLFGAAGARQAHESHARAVDLIEEVVRAENLDCEFTRLDGYLFAGATDHGDELQREFEAATRAGIAVERSRTFGTAPSLRFPNQGQMNPVAFMDGLAAAITRMGGRIHSGTLVSKIVGGGRPLVRTADGFSVEAQAVVVATNSPIDDNLTIHARQAPYRTYAIAASVPWEAVPRALYWDTLDPYHYVRLKSAKTPSPAVGQDVLIVGGEDHRPGETGDENSHFQALEQWTRERFPVAEVTRQWSGMVFEPADSLAFIGHDNSEQNVYIATGDSGHGITHGAITGILLTDLIAGRGNPWEALYDPRRVTAQAAKEYVSDNSDVVANLAKWLTPGEVSDRAQIAPGTGAVIRSGLAKHAVYRDFNGKLHELSAVCPHLGCIVAFNQAEQSWDCPCHGSRFALDGAVLGGPATRNLEAIE